jgi:enamine deaminase RidA (YjgF/YER057c/UK114 family)
MQRSAYEYGSSFARASTACTPAGRTVYISGTAAINEQGKTCHVGDIRGQIEMALECATAVLSDLQCPRDRIVQAMAYATSRQVEAEFRKLQSNCPAPWVIVRGDICRDDLLFEVELTACPGAQKLPS